MIAPLVIKVGGNDLSKPGFVEGLAHTVSQISKPCVLVHGGGRTVDDLLSKMEIVPQYVNGQRVTDEATLEVVEMVLSGQVNKWLTRSLINAGVDALGISGVDRGLLRVERWSSELGWVGRITSVRADLILDWCAQGVVPVISPISLGADGRYNVNADHAAGAIAAAINASQAVFVTNVAGVCIEDGVIPELTAVQITSMIADGTIYGGMIPKVNAALDALTSGVKAVTISDLSGLSAGAGTRITA